MIKRLPFKKKKGAPDLTTIFVNDFYRSFLWEPKPEEVKPPKKKLKAS